MRERAPSELVGIPFGIDERRSPWRRRRSSVSGMGASRAPRLSSATHSELASLLRAAERSRRPIGPLSDEHPELTIADGYAIQEHLLAARQADGERIIGAKLGFTSRAMREQMGIEEPNYGWLTDAMGVADGRIGLDTLIHPRVEPEIAIRLRDELRGPGIDHSDVLAATDAVHACLEIVDSRYIDYRFRAADNIADNSSAARVVLGAPVAPADIELRLVGVVLEREQTIVATAAGAAALGDPLAAVAWLANALADTDRTLEPGQIVLSGGLTAASPVHAGTTVRACFDRLGSVALQVA